MPESLQSLWPTLSPRERDALVAKAKGWEIELWDDHKKERQFPVVIKDDAGGCTRVCDPFSTDWHKSGPLLEEMLAAGCEIRMQPGTEKSIWAEGSKSPALLVAQKAAATIVATGDSWPERIALSYCLWKQVEP